jgi:adenosylmethionine-8-amino-7-oxononanoate aminotransferase
VAEEVLRILEAEQLVDAAAQKGERLRAMLEERLGGHPNVGEIRGLGLLLGVELVADRETHAPFPRAERLTKRIVRAGREAGVLLYSGTGLADGTNGDAIVLGPPFVTTDDELVAIADRLATAIEQATAAVPTASAPGAT